MVVGWTGVCVNTSNSPPPSRSKKRDTSAGGGQYAYGILVTADTTIASKNKSPSVEKGFCFMLI